MMKSIIKRLLTKSSKTNMTRWWISLLKKYMHMHTCRSIFLKIPIKRQNTCTLSKLNVVVIVIVWLTYSFKKQKKSSVLYLLISDHRAIKINIDQPCLEWKYLQVIDLFFPLFVSIETSPNKSSNQVTWIKDDKYNY